MFTAALLTIAFQGSVLPMLNDEQFCTLMRNNTPASAPVQPPLTSYTARVDCTARRVHATAKLTTTPEVYQAFKNNFLVTARTGVCNPSNPTMKSFADRGWKFHYRFENSDGTIDEHLLSC